LYITITIITRIFDKADSVNNVNKFLHFTSFN